MFALEVQGDSMEPLYRDGDVLIVSPNANIRKGDRVVVRTASGEVMAKELKRRTVRTIELRSLNPEHADRLIPVERDRLDRARDVGAAVIFRTYSAAGRSRAFRNVSCSRARSPASAWAIRARVSATP